MNDPSKKIFSYKSDFFFVLNINIKKRQKVNNDKDKQLNLIFSPFDLIKKPKSIKQSKQIFKKEEVKQEIFKKEEAKTTIVELNQTELVKKQLEKKERDLVKKKLKKEEELLKKKKKLNLNKNFIQFEFINLQGYKFDNLKKVFYSVYIDENFNESLYEKLDQIEWMLLAKLVSDKENHLYEPLDYEKIKKTCEFFFFGKKTRPKGFKVTNNKRFVFHKIKEILMEKYVHKNNLGRFRKKVVLKNFCSFYFENENIRNFENKEKMLLSLKDVKNVFKRYNENKIRELWKYQLFTKHFQFVIDNFNKEIKETYYKKKMRIFDQFIETLSKKNRCNIKLLELPWKTLPHNLATLNEFKDDFIKCNHRFFK